MSTIKSILQQKKPVHQRNFVKENVLQLKSMQNALHQKNEGSHQTASYKGGNQAPSKTQPHILKAPPCKPGIQLSNKTYRSVFTKTTPLTTDSHNLTMNKNVKHRNEYPLNNKMRKPSVPPQIKSPQKCRKTSTDLPVKKGDVSEFIRRQNLKPNLVDNSAGDYSTSEYTYSSESYPLSEHKFTPIQKFKESECQTVNPNCLESLYKDGVVLYPSKNWQKFQTRFDAANQTEKMCLQNMTNSSPPRNRQRTTDSAQLQVDSSSFAQGDTKQKNYMVNAEQKSPPSEHSKQRPGSQKGNVDNDSHQKDYLEEIMRILADLSDPETPKFALPENERREVLKSLVDNHGELIAELNNLPVRTDTLRVRQKKIEIESRLKKIEDGLKVFTRSKVYVRKT